VVAERDPGPCGGCIVTGVAMPWLADTDVGAAYGLARSVVGARTEAELRRRALEALAELVPADVLSWDRVALATGAVDHEASPAGRSPRADPRRALRRPAARRRRGVRDRDRDADRSR
jgi:hypothetical protein